MVAEDVTSLARHKQRTQEVLLFLPPLFCFNIVVKQILGVLFFWMTKKKYSSSVLLYF